MNRNIEHIVATHRLAAERRAAGRPVWDYHINLSDVFHNEAMSFEERRDAIVARLRASRWFTDAEEGGELHQYVEELADTVDGDDFDCPMDAIYDLADTDRVWIATF